MKRTYPDLARRIVHAHVLYCEKHKLIVESNGARRYYNLKEDPQEQRDLAKLAPDSFQACFGEYQRLARAGRYTRFERELPSGELQDANATEDLETLRSLGYVE
jgi:hypothetical protein